jgi:non-ribosomal peptide synthetase component E (peptide arylation enzyme)
MVIRKDDFNLSEKEVKDCLVEAGLEPFKFISGGVKFVEKFPKNSTGKIERTKLPEYFTSC